MTNPSSSISSSRARRERRRRRRRRRQRIMTVASCSVVCWTTMTILLFVAACIQTTVESLSVRTPGSRCHQNLCMDMEGESAATAKNRKWLQQTPPRLSFFSSHKKKPQSTSTIKQQIQTALSAYNMPWTSSIDPNYHNNGESPLTFMKFFTWQLDYMTEHLQNLTLLTSPPNSDSFTYHDNTHNTTTQSSKQQQQPSRIYNLQFTSSEYRKIRLTYYDAGNKLQVFNSLWYPNHDANLPVLGVDLLAFNKNQKMLCVVDFQPLSKGGSSHYEHLMKPILLQHPALAGSTMSKRFYNEDEDIYFSPYKLFTRFQNSSLILSDVFPAFQKFVRAHVVELVQAKKYDESNNQQQQLLLEQLHARYDTYSADRDPAKAMFAQVFGKEWADQFVHEFLFELSSRNSRVDDI